MTKDGIPREKSDSAPDISVPKKTVNHYIYIAQFANYAIWSLFGFLIRDMYIALPNALGALLVVYYIYRLTEYRIFTGDQRQAVIIGAGLAVAGVVLLYILVTSRMTSSTIVGFIAAGSSILFFGSPLSALKQVIETKSTASLNFAMSAVIALLTFLWALYGYLSGNAFVMIPNSIGFLLGLTQLALFYIYPTKPSPIEATI